MRNSCVAALLFGCVAVAAQDRPEIREIVDKLNHLEEQNRELMDQIRSLREDLAAVQAREKPAAQPGSEAPLAERMSVQEHRVEELEQTKVGAEQRLPVTLTGTVLFNAFMNGRYAADQMNPTTAALAGGDGNGGATLRQTILGLRFRGPTIAGGGKVDGSLFLDLFAGTGTSLNQLARLRVANLNFTWQNTTLSFAQDKPIMAPREPDSLAQVGVSPLTAAGNLWLWQPQFRLEQRIPFGERAGLRAQAGVYQTSETGAGVPSNYGGSLAPSRPGWEGRFEFWAQDGVRRIEIAPGFHVSQTHVLGQSIPSRVYSIDWLLRPFDRIDFTGQFFGGENTGVVGGLRQGVTVTYGRQARSVRALGGWAQIAIRATPRLSFHFYGGQEDDRNRDLAAQAIAKNQEYAGNVMYRIGPNVLASFEASQVRTTYLGVGTRLNPHYDLGVAYLF